jgi:hypothetical protein
MKRGQLLRVNGVKRPEQIQLLMVIRGGITQDSYLNVHPGYEAMVHPVWHDKNPGTKLPVPISRKTCCGNFKLGLCRIDGDRKGQRMTR